jgi:murein DD-endopeptidase MepM/ murein hydrolase activator NlpD
VLPTPRKDFDQHVVQEGDTLGSIADQYGISLEALMQANGVSDAEFLSIGQTLNIPAPFPGAQGPDFKIIPDSEMVYGPASAMFDVDAFVRLEDGYLASYSEDVNGEYLSGAEIVQLVAQNYSVNPRLLLALLEHQGGWVTSSTPFNLEYPLGLKDAWHDSLYLQLTWTADTLNRGYYLWRVNAVSTWVLADGSVVPVSPTINAGTAAVQHFFAKLDDSFTWHRNVTLNVSADGTLNNSFFQTYFFMFGNPFDLGIEPLVPLHLQQPVMQLPFEQGAVWSFTGGPHGGWDSGSGWAALDFGPPGETAGCSPSDAWVVAVANGWIVRTGDGAVVQDLDGDGFEQTGWSVFYMHIESRDRVQPKTYVHAGDKIGHPSCEGGMSNATHLHLARKYNGEWISADGTLPFRLDGWVSSGAGVEYDGFLSKDDQSIEAWDGQNELNQIWR